MSFHQNVSAEEKYKFLDDWVLSASGSFRGNFNTAGETFQSNDIPNQNLENQATSAAAYSTDYISLKLGIEKSDTFSLVSSVYYAWQKKYHLDLFPKTYSEKVVQLRDLYLNIPFGSHGYSVWFGRRTFEFEEIYLFQETNPFNQLELNGFGIETDVFQVSLALNKESVYTTAKDKNGNPLIDQNGNNILYENDDYVATLFMSGKFLLSEGKMFQPILSMRAYNSYGKDASENVQKDKVRLTSSFILGGIFDRPLSDGLKGTTTIWFSSLPADKEAKPTNTSVNNAFYGEGRVPPNYPQNTIGIADSSQFLFDKYGGLLTSIILLNNVYASNLPVLHISDDRKSLQSDGKSYSRTTNRVSVGVQPVVYLTRNIQLGLDLNFNYVTKKLLANDANSFVVTPILKYSFDEQLKTKKYLFISMSYGYYDWKIKTYSNGTKTNELLTTQAGVDFYL
ncbi:hypothetical protein QEJ31_04810 [Pigmentibacter sp. JX0631]|uniref:hypothetical protein n=1 Tax=Pigmentibacter sp. JX0631 TaxID=2976982 RepID=UPI002468D1EE|nr:hypothetical protein [Pigmentibacter sp. JX0631]WGL60917.1 hypothetical protein QEJ31_04810 [Pigmentibacter sp. JX0631]